MDAKALQSILAGRRIGSLLDYREMVDSTNLVALQLAREGAAEGAVVLAECQSQGRGRLDRVWQSPPGSNLYFSVILRPPVAPPDATPITLLAGVAVAEAIATVCAEGVGIKWPNDVRIHGRKVCGILTEMRKAEGESVVIVGIGLNVNIRKCDFDPAHSDTATSLREETGLDHSREDLFVLLCGRLEKWYQTFLHDGFAPVREGWLVWSEMTGRHVRILFRDEVQEGFVQGIDRDGALLISEGQGREIRRITAGDATIMKG